MINKKKIKISISSSPHSLPLLHHQPLSLHMKSVSLKVVSGAGTAAEITIPVTGAAGVNLGAIGWALGLDPSTVRLNGYFLSRGADHVSSLPWDSLLSFFAARGLPAGDSPLNSIVVQGKAVGRAGEYVGRLGFKRKFTLNNERPRKKNRIFEGCSKEQNVASEQVSDDDFLSIKRRLKLGDEPPSKKGKVDGGNSDLHSSNIKNMSHICLKREGTTEDGRVQKENIFLGGSSIERNFVTEQENNNEFFRLKRKLKINDDHRPFKKEKIGEYNSGLCNEASNLPLVFTKNG